MKKRHQRSVSPITPAPQPAPKRLSPFVNDSETINLMATDEKASVNPFKPYEPHPGVMPPNTTMAMDSQVNSGLAYAYENATFQEGLQFLGYPYLSQLTQRTEYRKCAEIMAMYMTKDWIEFSAVGEEDKAERIKQLEDEMKRLDVQGIYRKAIELEGFFGRAQIYVDIGVDHDDIEELKVPLIETKEKITIGCLKNLKIIEPINTYPSIYNTTDPLSEEFFNSTSWYVWGKQIHSTRMLTIVTREVPNLLKPAYAFGGLALTQVLKPYVDNWIRTRQSVSDLIHSFSIMGLKTNTDKLLESGGTALINKRANNFNAARDNKGLMIIDKTDEDIFNVSVPLSTLDKLQAQSQEQIASAASIPLVILLGQTPAGLNASSDGEFRMFYGWVNAQQEKLRHELQRLINIIMINLWGEVDRSIVFKFKPLWTMDEKELAEIQKIKAETDSIYINNGEIAPDEGRTRLAHDDTSPYSALDLNRVIEDPQEEEPSMEELLAGAKDPIEPDKFDEQQAK